MLTHVRSHPCGRRARRSRTRVRLNPSNVVEPRATNTSSAVPRSHGRAEPAPPAASAAGAGPCRVAADGREVGEEPEQPGERLAAAEPRPPPERRPPVSTRVQREPHRDHPWRRRRRGRRARARRTPARPAAAVHWPGSIRRGPLGQTQQPGERVVGVERPPDVAEHDADDLHPDPEHDVDGDRRDVRRCVVDADPRRASVTPNSTSPMTAGDDRDDRATTTGGRARPARRRRPPRPGAAAATGCAAR